MIHFFGDRKRRKINLGRGSKVVSQAELLEQPEDDVMKDQSKNTRAMLLYKIVVARSQRGEGGQDKTEGRILKRCSWAGWACKLECLVLMGHKGEEALGTWSSQMVQFGEGE